FNIGLITDSLNSAVSGLTDSTVSPRLLDHADTRLATVHVHKSRIPVVAAPAAVKAPGRRTGAVRPGAATHALHRATAAHPAAGHVEVALRPERDRVGLAGLVGRPSGHRGSGMHGTCRLQGARSVAERRVPAESPRRRYTARPHGSPATTMTDTTWKYENF